VAEGEALQDREDFDVKSFVDSKYAHFKEKR
jgi:hypothetical protein